MDSCVFCDIIDNPSKARTVFSDPYTVAFLPLAPATRGHTLVVPRTHFADLWTMDDLSVQHLTRTTLAVGRALRAALEPEGMNVINSAGTAASQSVFHCHTPRTLVGRGCDGPHLAAEGRRVRGRRGAGRPGRPDLLGMPENVTLNSRTAGVAVATRR